MLNQSTNPQQDQARGSRRQYPRRTKHDAQLNVAYMDTEPGAEDYMETFDQIPFPETADIDEADAKGKFILDSGTNPLHINFPTADTKTLQSHIRIQTAASLVTSKLFRSLKVKTSNKKAFQLSTTHCQPPSSQYMPSTSDLDTSCCRKRQTNF